MAIKKKSIFRAERGSLIFYSLMMIWPILQFCVFYIGVNFNSVLLAFKEIDPLDYSKYTYTFDNFTNWFKGNSWLELKNSLGISLKVYVISLAIGVPLGLFFSYYIYKKMPLATFYRVMLFLPSILSSVVLARLYQYFTDWALPELLAPLHIEYGTKDVPTLFATNSEYKFVAVMAFNIFVSFGTTVLMYSNKMSTISPEIIESAHLDGAGALTEFFYVVLPLSFSTISVFLVTGVAGIFTNQINNYALFSYDAPTEVVTVGYLIYNKTRHAASINRMPDFPFVAALAVMLTLVAVPLTYGVRFLLNKFGPKED